MMQELENDENGEIGKRQQILIYTRIPSQLPIKVGLSISVCSFLKEKLGIRRSSHDIGACVGSWFLEY